MTSSRLLRNPLFCERGAATNSRGDIVNRQRLYARPHELRTVLRR